MQNFLFIFFYIFFAGYGTAVGAEIRTIEVQFAFTAPADQAAQLLGYKLYKNGVQICETPDASASSMTCDFSTDAGTYSFALKAYYGDGTESPASPEFLYTIEPTTTFPGTVPLPNAVASSSSAVGNAPLLVTFDGSASTTPNPPIVRYSWSFGDNSSGTGETTSHLFTSPGTYEISLTVEDSSGFIDTSNIPVVVSEAIQPGEIVNAPLSALDFNIEIGEVSIDNTWFRVFFENTFNQPIVIAGPPTLAGKGPVTVRIRNIDQTGFEIRLQEWDYMNDIHVQETVNYIVMEEGAYTLENGSRIEAGSFTGLKSFQQVTLQQAYSNRPIILTQVSTEKDTDAVTGRVRKIRETSFEYRLQEQQATMKSHNEEEVGYIAWEPGQGTFSGLVFEAGATARKVTQKWYDINYLTEFTKLPYLFTNIQTLKERDTATLRCRRMSQEAVQIKIQEEKSRDSEIRHKKEAVGYLVIGAADG